MLKRRWWIVGVVLAVLLLLSTSTAMAEENPGVRGRIIGESHITYKTSTYAEYFGKTEVTGAWRLLPPDELLLILDLFKGDTWIGPGLSLPGIPGEIKVVGTYEASSSLPGDWQGVGWHYAYWLYDGIEDSAATYDPPLSSSLIQPVYTRLEVYCDNTGQSMKNWCRVDYLRSSEILKTLLGHEAGVSLDKMFHYDLRSYLKPGDKMPGLLVSPDGSSAQALFFHADGTMTVIELSNTEDKAWGIVEVRAEKVAKDPEIVQNK